MRQASTSGKVLAPGPLPWFQVLQNSGSQVLRELKPCQRKIITDKKEKKKSTDRLHATQNGFGAAESFRILLE